MRQVDSCDSRAPMEIRLRTASYDSFKGGQSLRVPSRTLDVVGYCVHIRRKDAQPSLEDDSGPERESGAYSSGPDSETIGRSNDEQSPELLP